MLHPQDTSVSAMQRDLQGLRVDATNVLNHLQFGVAGSQQQ